MSFRGQHRFKDWGGRGHNDRRVGHRSREDWEQGVEQGRGWRDREEQPTTERMRHPANLRGREIGMWYARGSRAREVRERANRSTVSIDSAGESNIRKLLSHIQESGASTSSSGGSASSQTKSERSTGGSPRCAHVEPASCSFNVDQELPMDVLEPPESWEELDCETHDSSVKLETETVDTKHFPQEEQVDLDEYDDDGHPLPNVAAVVEFMKLDDNLTFVVDEPDLLGGFESRVPDSGCTRLDQELADKMKKVQHDSLFLNMLSFRKNLPAYRMRDALVEAVNKNQVLVISGETGCGKTTQVPQIILDDWIRRGVGSQCRVICTQPRRISAISVAERVAAERCEIINDTGTSSVGYQIRLDIKKPRPQGSILFCTTGIILKFLENDPLLQRASHLIMDEVHERDLQSDFLMIIVKDLLPRRPDLKLILMSATLNAEMFSCYFNNCPMVNIPGHMFPVKEYLLEDVLEMTGYVPDDSQQSQRARSRRLTAEEIQANNEYKAWCRSLCGSSRYSQRTVHVLQDFNFNLLDISLVYQVINYICSHMEDGAVLVFVPGWEEIRKLNEMLQSTARYRSGSLRVIPLHSLMPTVNQREVFDRPPSGVRKIVIATNIAETSITIDDIVFVVDCGKIKMKTYQPEKNLTSLQSQWVCMANAKQRRGRAGRVKPGHCFHLYTKFHFDRLLDFHPPEILRTGLEELCLQIKLLRLGRIVPFISKAMQHPSMEAITCAIEALTELNALDNEENLLPLGYHLARLPMEPHTGKMVLFAAMFSCLDPILTVAASFSFKYAFVTPLGREELVCARLTQGSKSDHMTLINAYKGWEQSLRQGNSKIYCWQNFLSENTLHMLQKRKIKLAEILNEFGFIHTSNPGDKQANRNSENLGLIRAILCAGMYPNVCLIGKRTKQSEGVSMLIKDSSRVYAHPKSVNYSQTVFESKWMVFHHKFKISRRDSIPMLPADQVCIPDSTMVLPIALLFFGGEIQIFKEDETELVSLNGWITFKASASTVRLVQDLRRQLNRLLLHKITHTAPTVWDTSDPEGALMTAIVELVTSEEQSYSSSGRGKSKVRHHRS